MNAKEEPAAMSIPVSPRTERHATAPVRQHIREPKAGTQEYCSPIVRLQASRYDVAPVRAQTSPTR